MGKANDLEHRLEAPRNRLHHILQQMRVSAATESLTAEPINELSAALEELQIAAEDLRQQNEELVNSQQSLLEEKKRYETLFDFAPEGYLVTDGSGEIQKANRAAERLFNVRQDLLVGEPLSLFVAPEDQPIIFELIERSDADIFSQNQDSPHGQAKNLIQGREITLNPRNQEAFPIFLSLTLEYGSESEIGCLLWRLQDIRELKRHEAERQQAISERLATQAASLQNERRYQQILNAIPDLIFVKDRNSRLVWANQALQDFYGMSLEEIQGIVDTPFSDPEFTSQYLEDDVVVFENGESLDIPEESIVRHDGTVQSFSTVKSPIRNQQGEVTELVGVSRDITQRLQAERELQERDQQWRHFAENSHAVVWMTRPDLQASTYVNPAYERVWGRSRQSLIDNPESWLEAVHPEDRERMQATMGNQLPDQLTPDEYRIIHPDGSIRWIRDQGFALRNDAGEVYGYGGLAEDITDRKQLELVLSASEAQKSQILNSAVASIVSMWVYANQDFEYELYSNGCEVLYGYTPEELMADKHLWLSRLEPEDRDVFLNEAFEKIFAEQTFTSEFRFRHRDGSIRWIASSHTSRKIADDCWQVVAVNQDITERKQAQEELQQQVLRDKLVTSTTQEIRQSLELDTVLSRTVRRVRKLLKADRVVIFQFQTAPGGDRQGEVIKEAARHGTPSILHEQLNGPCFEKRYIEPYQDGRITVVEDTDRDDINPCYQELLRQLQVRANLVAPLQHNQRVWGLLVAHQCSGPRQWQATEIDLVKQISSQVSIAIQQSELYEETRQQLREIEAIYDTAPTGLASLDRDLRFVRVNQYLADINGFAIADHIGRNTLELTPDLAPQIEPYLRQVLETGEPVLQVEITGEIPAQPGVTRSWLESWIPLTNSAGEVIGINLVVLEITRRKEIDAKLREQAALLDISTDAIFVRDLDHRILYWNRGAEMMYGWTAEEAVGQTVYDLLRCGADLLTDITQKLLQNGYWQGEIQDLTKDGRRLTVLARWTLVRNDAGDPQSILSVITDITDRKRLEQQFYQSQRLEALGTLTGGIAHDLNNVLSPILAMSQLLRMTQKQLAPAAQEQLQLIEQSAKRGATMVKQILTLTRGSTEEPTPTAVEPILAELVAIARKSFPKAIEIVLTTPSPDPNQGNELVVMADSTHLHQLVMNLCINARDAMPDGGRLTLSAERIGIDQATAGRYLDARQGDYVRISVVDTGMGIEPELRDRIFDPFFTTKTTGKGTGLGLAMVRGIVKNYGGFLQVDSTVGQGTHISIYLPALEGSAPRQVSPSSSSPSAPCLTGKGKLILIVEDDPNVQKTSRSLLEAHDYRVRIANDGYEALDCYRRYQDEIQLVLLDITMPGMSGIELIQRLKGINPAVQVVAISGLVSNRQPSLDAGANAFLAKPYTLKALLGTLNRLLSA
jgi:PAS domain S-box-containing protein